VTAAVNFFSGLPSKLCTSRVVEPVAYLSIMICKNVYAFEMLVDDRASDSAGRFDVNGSAVDPPEPQPPAMMIPVNDASAKTAVSRIARC
jgi:hypothetical protein